MEEAVIRPPKDRMNSHNCMRTLNTTTIVLGLGIAILFAAGGAYGYGFVALKNKAKHAAELTEAYDAEQGKDTRQTALRSALRDTRDQVEELDTYFLHRDHFPRFVASLETLGEETGTVISPSGTVEGNADQIGLDVAIEGRFEDVFQAIKLIELLPYRVEVRKIHMSSMGEVTPKEGDTAPGREGNQWKAIVGFDIVSFTR